MWQLLWVTVISRMHLHHTRILGNNWGDHRLLKRSRCCNDILGLKHALRSGDVKAPMGFISLNVLHINTTVNGGFYMIHIGLEIFNHSIFRDKGFGRMPFK